MEKRPYICPPWKSGQWGDPFTTINSKDQTNNVTVNSFSRCIVAEQIEDLKIKVKNNIYGNKSGEWKEQWRYDECRLHIKNSKKLYDRECLRDGTPQA